MNILKFSAFLFVGMIATSFKVHAAAHADPWFPVDDVAALHGMSTGSFEVMFPCVRSSFDNADPAFLGCIPPEYNALTPAEMASFEKQEPGSRKLCFQIASLLVHAGTPGSRFQLFTSAISVLKTLKREGHVYQMGYALIIQEFLKRFAEGDARATTCFLKGLARAGSLRGAMELWESFKAVVERLDASALVIGDLFRMFCSIDISRRPNAMEEVSKLPEENRWNPDYISGALSMWTYRP